MVCVRINMSLDLLALGLAVLWGAVSLPLVWLNPLGYDETATKVLVYAVAPFIFFSVIFVIIGVVMGMRRRGQIRDERSASLQSRLMELNYRLRRRMTNHSDEHAANEFIFGLYRKAINAFENEKHSVAEKHLADAERAMKIQEYEPVRR